MTASDPAAASADWFGDRAVTVSLPQPAARHAVAGALARTLPHLIVRPGMTSVLVEAPEPDPGLLMRVREALSTVAETPGEREPRGAAVSIPVTYGGEDLDVVANLLGLGREAVVSAHAGQLWSVAMMGFAPGFGYLIPVGDPVVDWSLLARRDQPRERVPAGSVAVAAGMSAVYPTAMPGGWHLIGRTDIPLFDAAASVSPTLLHAGDRIRFVAVEG